MNYIVYCADDCLYVMSDDRGYTVSRMEAGMFEKESAKILCTTLNSANFTRRVNSSDERFKIIPCGDKS